MRTHLGDQIPLLRGQNGTKFPSYSIYIYKQRYREREPDRKLLMERRWWTWEAEDGKPGLHSRKHPSFEVPCPLYCVLLCLWPGCLPACLLASWWSPLPLSLSLSIYLSIYLSLSFSLPLSEMVALCQDTSRPLSLPGSRENGVPGWVSAQLVGPLIAQKLSQFTSHW